MILAANLSPMVLEVTMMVTAGRSLGPGLASEIVLSSFCCHNSSKKSVRVSVLQTLRRRLVVPVLCCFRCCQVSFQGRGRVVDLGDMHTCSGTMNENLSYQWRGCSMW